MALYLEYSTRIYSIYLKYIAPEDIFPYSIDEVFMDVTDYLHTYNMTARELAMTMIQDVLKTTGITATAGKGYAKKQQRSASQLFKLLCDKRNCL